MVIFHSYVSLPEGKSIFDIYGHEKKMTKPMMNHPGGFPKFQSHLSFPLKSPTAETNAS